MVMYWGEQTVDWERLCLPFARNVVYRVASPDDLCSKVQTQPSTRTQTHLYPFISRLSRGVTVQSKLHLSKNRKSFGWNFVVHVLWGRPSCFIYVGSCGALEDSGGPNPLLNKIEIPECSVSAWVSAIRRQGMWAKSFQWGMWITPMHFVRFSLFFV